MSDAKIQLSLAQARRAAIEAQALDRASDDTAAILERTGFIRTLGGADVYLAARARVAGFTRSDLDTLVEQGRFHVSPTVRGCIYLLAREHREPSLRLAELLSARRVERDHEKVGLPTGELAQVGEAVRQALADGPLTTQALRRALPDGTVRSLGDIGKKVGLSSTLPPALRRLEFDGALERVLDGGRLDTERYLWRLLDGAADDAAARPVAVEDVHRHMAEVYLRAAAFGGRNGFAGWSGLGKRDAQKALDGLDTVAVRVEGLDEPQVALAENASTLASLAADTSGDSGPVAFLPFEDNLIALKEGPAFFVDPEHHGLQVPVWGRGKGTTLGNVRHGALRTVVAEDKLVGFWEFDPEAQSVVVGLFAGVGGETRQHIDQEAVAVGRFLRDEIGHAKSISIDNEAQMRKRCTEIRALSA